MSAQPDVTLEIIYRGLRTAFHTVDGDVSIGNVRVQVTPTRSCYVSVAALCGTAQFGNGRSLFNPQVIVDVRFQWDRFYPLHSISSLMDYVTVSQKEMRVSHYARQSPTQWILTDYTNLDDVVTLTPLGMSLTLAAIYREIELNLPPSEKQPLGVQTVKK